MTGRDDFRVGVVEELRKRAGGRCSVPYCRAATTGPSDGRVSGVSNVGVAAHITAAAPGGPRFDPRMTPQQRRSRGNGIWVCQTHGKVIDDDERRYTAELLRAWRDRAESLAADELGRPIASRERPGLIPHQTVLIPGRERQGTADFMEDVAALAVWGKQRSDLVWMVLYELAINATRHGGASTVTLCSEPGSIHITDDGQQFGLSDLIQSNQRGGGDAVHALRDTATGIGINHRYRNGSNEWFITDHSRTAAADDPCGIHLGPRQPSISFAAVAECDEIDIYVDGRWSFSDIHGLTASIPENLRLRSFRVHGIDPGGALASRLCELLPNVRLTELPDFP